MTKKQADEAKILNTRLTETIKRATSPENTDTPYRARGVRLAIDDLESMPVYAPLGVGAVLMGVEFTMSVDKSAHELQVYWNTLGPHIPGYQNAEPLIKPVSGNVITFTMATSVARAEFEKRRKIEDGMAAKQAAKVRQ